MSNRPRTRSATRNEQLRDRLSDLPLDIIHDILCRIPVRDAVRTCVLSREWRTTWTTLPYLVFDSDGDEPMDRSDTSIKKFISEVLLHHQGPIQIFKMSYPFFSGIGSVEHWLLLLAGKDVKFLDLRVSDYGVILDLRVSDYGASSLNSSLYNCLKLTDLSVWYFKMCPPPLGFEGFKFLTSIVLAGVELSTTGLESLVNHCQVLKYLSMQFCPILELRISSPNLKDLQICGPHRKLSLYAPKLERIHVEISSWDHLWHNNQGTGCNYTNLLGSCTNLVELSGDGFFTLYLTVRLEPSNNTLVFLRLKAIQLRGMRVTDASSTAVVARLIKDAPNLEKIELASYLVQIDGARDVSYRDHFKFSPSFTLEKLKDVKLKYICEGPTGVQIAKFLLEASPVLETMEIEIPRSCVDEVSAELLSIDKAAPNAKVTFVTFTYAE